MKAGEALPFLRVSTGSAFELGHRVTLRVRPLQDGDLGWTWLSAAEFITYFGNKPILGQVHPVLELHDGTEEEYATYSCAVDLVLGRWRYLLERSHWAVARSDFATARARPPFYALTPRRVALLKRVVAYLSTAKREDRSRRHSAIRRWHAAASTRIGMDSIMHLIAALEGLLLRGTGDMRLRLALRSAAAVPARKRRAVFQTIYESYKLRNDYAHGVRIPEVGRIQQLKYVSTATEILWACIELGATNVGSLDRRVLRWLPEEN